MIPVARLKQGQAFPVADLSLGHLEYACNVVLWNGPHRAMPDRLREIPEDAVDRTVDFNPYYFDFEPKDRSLIELFSEFSWPSAGSASLSMRDAPQGGFDGEADLYECAVTALGAGGFALNVYPDGKACSYMAGGQDLSEALCAESAGAGSPLT